MQDSLAVTQTHCVRSIHLGPLGLWGQKNQCRHEALSVYSDVSNEVLCLYLRNCVLSASVCGTEAG